MTANLILEIVVAAIGAIMAVCPYDKIKMFFPRAKSEKVIKAVGVVAAVGGVIAAVMELAG